MARSVMGGRTPSASNTTPSGAPQGTTGGTRAVGAKPGTGQLAIGDEVYLWALVLLEVGAMAWLRKNFRRYHGG